MPRYSFTRSPWASTTSPGASSVPASSEPAMIVSAPAAIAFAMSPDEVSPPSAITGTPCSAAAREHSSMAVTCGTPTPATTRVVQIDPGPTPTFTASAPASTSASVASAVATLPTTSSAPSKRAFSSRAIASTPTEWPCAVSSTSTSAPGVDERPGTIERVRPDADGGRNTQPPLVVLRRVRVRDPLRDVLDGDEAAQHAVRVHDGQLLDLVAVEDALGLLESRALRRSDEPVARHQLRHRAVWLAVEAQVAVREDADEPAALVRDGNAGDAVGRHQLERVGHAGVRPQRDGLDDHARLRAFDLVHLARLFGDGEVAVNDADATHARERDRHAGLGDRVHGRRDDGNPQLDRPREARGRGNVVRKYVRFGRDEQDVVERQALPRELRLEREQPLDPAELEIRMHLLRQVRMNGSSARRWRRP